MSVVYDYILGKLRKKDTVATGDVISGLTQGSVLFGGASGTLQQDNANFFWDDNNNRIGVGTNSPISSFEVQKNSLGATASDTSGILLRNTTAAAAGAQQVSPSRTYEGQGWKLNATAASQSVRVQEYLLPVQGSASPSGTWILAASINGGSYNTMMSMTSLGTFTINNPNNSTVAMTWNGSDRSGQLTFNGGNLQLNGGTTGASYQSTRDSSGGGLQRFGAFNGNSVTTFFTLFDDNTAHVMAQRNGTNAQIFRVYKTSASSNANYERGVLDWQTSSNVFTVGTQAGGTGTLRELSLIGSSITAGANLSVTGNVEPTTDDTYYLGRNDDDSPKAWKGVIMKDTVTGTYYRLQVTSGVVTLVDLSD